MPMAWEVSITSHEGNLIQGSRSEETASEKRHNSFFSLPFSFPLPTTKAAFLLLDRFLGDSTTGLHLLQTLASHVQSKL